ncbi:hypothetical protein HUJ05_001921 [Dendroctonus ponderosae]|nr:hypothetical protein HUJ05_001921 [Dendroctonus ponderosae]
MTLFVIACGGRTAISNDKGFSMQIAVSGFHGNSYVVRRRRCPNVVEEQVKTKLSDFNFFEYVSIDNGILTREILTDEQIIDSVTSSTALSDNEKNDDLVPDVDDILLKNSLLHVPVKILNSQSFQQLCFLKRVSNEAPASTRRVDDVRRRQWPV